MLPTTENVNIRVFMQSVRYFYPILTELGTYRQLFTEFSNIILHVNPSCVLTRTKELTA